MSESRPVVIIGGQSRLGRALAGVLGPRASLISRHDDADPRTICLADYHLVSEEHLTGAAAVVNCAGLVHGASAELTHANVELPRLLTARCLAAGVSRFVQISSFSVYGGAEEITWQTVELPASDYGRSKLAADNALRAGASPHFQPVSLRVPMLVDEAPTNKLAKLVRLVMRTRLAPMPARPVRRAMIGYDAAASVAAQLADSAETGVVLAADPVHFTYDLLVEAIQSAGKMRIRRLPIPDPVSTLIKAVQPHLHASLLQSSRLPNEVNFVRGTAPGAGLPAILSNLIAKIASGSA